MQKIKRTINAFTLIEILVTVTIIGMLTAFSVTSYIGFSKQSRDSKRTADLQQIQQALEMYRSNEGEYPTPCPTNTTNCDSGLPFGSGSLTGANNNLYFQSLPKGPKADAYIYDSQSPYQSYVLCSNLESGSVYSLNPYGKGTSCAIPTQLAYASTPTPGPIIIPTPPSMITCGKKTLGNLISLGKICM